MKDKGIIYNRCMDFSISITGLCKLLQQQGDYIIPKQTIPSATSIGANYSEALGAENDNDFIHKPSISLKKMMTTSMLTAKRRMNNNQPA